MDPKSTAGGAAFRLFSIVAVSLYLAAALAFLTLTRRVRPRGPLHLIRRAASRLWRTLRPLPPGGSLPGG